MVLRKITATVFARQISVSAYRQLSYKIVTIPLHALLIPFGFSSNFFLESDLVFSVKPTEIHACQTMSTPRLRTIFWTAFLFCMVSRAIVYGQVVEPHDIIFDQNYLIVPEMSAEISSISCGLKPDTVCSSPGYTWTGPGFRTDGSFRER